MFGKHDLETGRETYAKQELVRLAIPRRVYTKSQVDYVVESIIEIFEQRDKIRGVRIVQQPKTLRHFTATFELV
jgi:tryptophanase